MKYVRGSLEVQRGGHRRVALCSVDIAMTVIGISGGSQVVFVDVV